ncbi:MAG TPA: prepilin peptidase [Myxococcales bacterium]|nr:prepilin peptidase [Myxococcales bacterium]
MLVPVELAQAPLQAKVALVTLFVALAISVVTDLRRRLILNLVTLPALAIVGACFLWLGGFSLLLQSAIGALVCAGPLALAMWRGWMGAGDVKLIAVSGAVAGAAAGWPFALLVLLYVAIAGGIQGILWIAGARLRGLEKPKYVPYGLSIAAGTLAAFLLS